MKDFQISEHYQTPKAVCDYMASRVLMRNPIILEPSPGMGNLVTALLPYGKVISPTGDFWKHYETWKNTKPFDYVVMNPPFSPMSEGYRFLDAAMELAPVVVALMPWLTLINSERRFTKLKAFGLISVTHLPRKAFPGSRVQTCILELGRGFVGQTELKNLTL